MKKQVATLLAVSLLQLAWAVRAENLQNAVFKAIASYPQVRAEISRKSAQEQALRQADIVWKPIAGP